RALGLEPLDEAVDLLPSEDLLADAGRAMRRADPEEQLVELTSLPGWTWGRLPAGVLWEDGDDPEWEFEAAVPDAIAADRPLEDERCSPHLSGVAVRGVRCLLDPLPEVV